MSYIKYLQDSFQISHTDVISLEMKWCSFRSQNTLETVWKIWSSMQQYFWTIEMIYSQSGFRLSSLCDGNLLLTEMWLNIWPFKWNQDMTFWKRLGILPLKPQQNPAFLFNVICFLLVISLFLPASHMVTHVQFCYQFKAQREVSEGACQSDKLSPKWWQIGRLSAHFPIKSRPGFHARTGSCKWRSMALRWSSQSLCSVTHSFTPIWT